VLASIEDFKGGGDEAHPSLPFLKIGRQEPDFSRYSVNVIVNNGEANGAPCVFESNPTYYNLFGRIEHRFQMGAAFTDFTMIKSGPFTRRTAASWSSRAGSSSKYLLLRCAEAGDPQPGGEDRGRLGTVPSRDDDGDEAGTDSPGREIVLIGTPRSTTCCTTSTRSTANCSR